MVRNRAALPKIVRRKRALILAGALCVGAANASAGTVPYEAAFTATFRDPGNIEKAFAFVKEAIAAGDREGAIAALDRILIVSPNQPRVRLLLARLYGELKSYEQAKSYAQFVLDSDADEEIKREAQSILKAAAQQQPGHTFTGSLGSALSYQSNVTQAPGAAVVGTSTGVIYLPTASRARADSASVSSVLLVHNWRPEDAAWWSWLTARGAVASEQARVTTSTFGLADIASGPRIDLSAALGTPATFWAYGATTRMLLSSHPYLAGHGGGAILTMDIRKGTSLEVSGDVRDTRYSDSAIAPDAHTENGRTSSLRAGIKQRSFGTIDLLAGGVTSRIDAEQAGKAHADRGIFAGFSMSFAGPKGFSPTPWTISATVWRTFAAYRAPDATVDSLIVRGDRTWRVDTALKIPLAERVDSFASVGHVANESNIELKRYRATTATAGLVLSF